MTKKITKKNTCLVCGSRRLIRYLDLGESPLANSYVKKMDLKKPEPVFPLQVYYCTDCHLAQLTDIISRKLLFENYAYFSSASPQLHEHFLAYATEVFNAFPLQAQRLTVEIASNDGILLNYFQKRG